MGNGKDAKLSYEDFVRQAIVNLRQPKYRGIHSVYSGFNQAFRKYYNEDPVAVIRGLDTNGKIEIRPVKGGVMIYLPGEAPKTKTGAGDEALLKILGKAAQHDETLINKVISEIAPGGPKKFPDDFLDDSIVNNQMNEIKVPGTLLQIDPNSLATVVSPKRHFHYEAKNPAIAKYIVYSNELGSDRIPVPENNQLVFKAVKKYEGYCRDLREKCYMCFQKHTSNEETAEILTKEVERKLNLKAIDV